MMVTALVVLFVLLAAAAGGWLAFVSARQKAGPGMFAHLPREQPRKFEIKLREQVFRDPFATMKLLFSDERTEFVRKVWRDCKPPAVGAGAGAALPSDGMFVHRTRLKDGRAIAVVGLPEPERDGEAHRIAIVLPQDKSLRGDVPRARRQVRYLVLNRIGEQHGRATELFGWTPDGRRRAYKTGAPLEPDPFAAAVGEKLRELKL